MQNQPFKRIAIALAALAVLAACEKHDATAGQAANALNNLASQTNQKFDQAASYVGQHVDAAKQAAQDNLDRAGTLPSCRRAASPDGTRESRRRGERDQRGDRGTQRPVRRAPGLKPPVKSSSNGRRRTASGVRGASASSAAESSETRPIWTSNQGLVALDRIIRRNSPNIRLRPRGASTGTDGINWRFFGFH